MAVDKIREIRIQKAEQLRKKGLNPYPATTKRTHFILEILNSFEDFKTQQKEITLVGRIRLIREHSQISFINFEDGTGTIQACFMQEKLSEKYNDFLEYFDIGDFIEIKGVLFNTKRGEKTIEVQDYRMLTKSILPLPTKWHGLQDLETRLRQRYLDFIMNPKEKEIFKKKAIFWQSIRSFLDKNGFIAVDTAALEAIPGGADAKPFMTHYNALNTNFYLRISLELALKRFIIGGFNQVYEIGKVFRNEGISSQHLQDYLMLEFYWAYADYNVLMEFLEKMYQYIIQATTNSLVTTYQGHFIDWSKKWPREDYCHLFKQTTGIDLAQTNKEELFDYLIKLGEKKTQNLGEGRLIDLIFKKEVRKNLIQPTFLINHPLILSPLAKKREENQFQVERFNIVAGGVELGNGFSELNDPLDQALRFKEQAKLREAGDDEAQMMNEDFVIALEYGMPPTAGFGLSERLFAFLMDRSIRETVFTPAMKLKS